MSLSPAWINAVESYLRAERSAGKPSTTLATRRQQLHNLGANVGVDDPWSLTGQQLVDWAGSRDWAQETRRSRRTTFLSFWRWAIEAELTDKNPAAALRRVRATDPNPHPVPLDVLERALTAATPRVELMIRLGVDLGMRRGEIAVVHSRDIFQDLDGWSLRVHGKGRRERDMTLSRRLALELRSLPAGWAFPGAIDGHLSARRVGELVNAVLEGEWTIHSLRHRAGQNWLDQTGNLAAVQDGLGHASPATTRRYVKPRNDTMRRMIEASAS